MKLILFFIFSLTFAQEDLKEFNPLIDRFKQRRLTVGKMIAAQAATDRLSGSDRKTICAQKMTLEDAKNHVRENSNELLAARDNLRYLTMTKTMTKTMHFYDDEALENKEYLEAIARAYKNAHDENCQMCDDELRILSKRKELLQKLGYNGQSCRPNSNKPPEVVILYENHVLQEQKSAPTAKRGGYLAQLQSQMIF